MTENAMFCPFCDAELGTTQLFSGRLSCRSCATAFQPEMLAAYWAGALPPDGEVHLERDEMVLSSCRPTQILLGFLLLIFGCGLAVPLARTGGRAFLFFILAFLVVFVTLLRCSIFQLRVRRRSDMLAFSSGIGRLRITYEWPVGSVAAVTVKTVSGKRGVSGKLQLELTTGEIRTFGSGFDPLTLQYLADWISGREFTTLPLASGAQQE